MAEFFVYARLRGGRKTVIRVWDVDNPEAARQVVASEFDCRCVLTLVPRGSPPVVAPDPGPPHGVRVRAPSVAA